MAAVIDHPESADHEYLLADADTPDLQTVLTHCAQAAGVSPPRLVMPAPLLSTLVRWPWLARQIGASPEQVHFLRREPLDTAATEQLAERMGIRKPALA